MDNMIPMRLRQACAQLRRQSHRFALGHAPALQSLRQRLSSRNSIVMKLISPLLAVVL